MLNVERCNGSMLIEVKWSANVAERFPGLRVCIGEIRNVHNEKTNEQVRMLSSIVYDEVKARCSIETLKTDPTVRAYRDFYWKLDIDPTKTRPSGEALLRRVLHGDELPQISTVVDGYNLVSMKAIIPVSGFDYEKLDPPFQVRFAESTETFAGIGMSKPLALKKNTLVLADQNQILCIYPYRDSDHSKITFQTRDALIVAYGSPGITENQLMTTIETTLSYIKQTSQGEVTMMKSFSTNGSATTLTHHQTNGAKSTA